MEPTKEAEVVAPVEEVVAEPAVEVVIAPMVTVTDDLKSPVEELTITKETIVPQTVTKETFTLNDLTEKIAVAQREKDVAQTRLDQANTMLQPLLDEKAKYDAELAKLPERKSNE